MTNPQLDDAPRPLFGRFRPDISIAALGLGIGVVLGIALIAAGVL